MPQIDDDSKYLVDAVPPAPKRRRTYDENQPETTDWSLDRLPDLQSWYATQFPGKKLPVVNRGQGSVHNKMGLDHRESADVGLNPTTPEGRAFGEHLKANNVPFLAFDRAVPGAATGPHYHLGRPSHKSGVRYPVGSLVRRTAQQQPTDEDAKYLIDDEDPEDAKYLSAAEPSTPDITKPLNTLTNKVNKLTAAIPQPISIMPRDLSWHFGMDTDEFNALPKATQNRIVQRTHAAVAEDERKKKAGQSLAPSLSYINENRRKLKLPSKSVMATSLPQPDTSSDRPYDVFTPIREAAPSPHRAAGMGELHELDDPEVARRQRIAADIANERLARSESGRTSMLEGTGLDESDIVNARVTEERAAEARAAEHARRTQEIAATFTERDRALLAEGAAHLRGEGSTARGMDIGAQRVGSGLLYKMAALADLEGTALNLVDSTGQSEFGKFLRRNAARGEVTIQQIEAELPPNRRQRFADFITRSIGALPEIFGATAIGGPIGGFAALGGLEAKGRGAPAGETLMETGKQGLIGAGFKYAGALETPAIEGVRKTAFEHAMDITRSGVGIGAATYGVERAFGATQEEALQATAQNLLFHGTARAISAVGDINVVRERLAKTPEPTVSTDLQNRLTARDIAAAGGELTSEPGMRPRFRVSDEQLRAMQGGEPAALSTEAPPPETVPAPLPVAPTPAAPVETKASVAAEPTERRAADRATEEAIITQAHRTAERFGGEVESKPGGGYMVRMGDYAAEANTPKEVVDYVRQFASEIAADEQAARVTAPEPATPVEVGQPVNHPNPAHDGKEILATTADDHVIVATPENKSGVSVLTPEQYRAKSDKLRQYGEMLTREYQALINHRARREGFTLVDESVVNNYLKRLRAFAETHNPDRVGLVDRAEAALDRGDLAAATAFSEQALSGTHDFASKVTGAKLNVDRLARGKEVSAEHVPAVTKTTTEVERRLAQAEPALITKLRKEVSDLDEFYAKGGKKMGSGGPDTRELIARAMVRGYDLYVEHVKPTFEDWSRRLREEFGEHIEPHLKNIWKKVRVEGRSDRMALDIDERQRKADEVREAREEARIAKLKATHVPSDIVTKAVEDVNARQKYGRRTETITKPSYRLSWSNAQGEWGVYSGKEAPGEKSLDANEILVTASRAQADAIAHRLPPLPLGRLSFEQNLGKGRLPDYEALIRAHGEGMDVEDLGDIDTQAQLPVSAHEQARIAGEAGEFAREGFTPREGQHGYSGMVVRPNPDGKFTVERRVGKGMWEQVGPRYPTREAAEAAIEEGRDVQDLTSIGSMMRVGDIRTEGEVEHTRAAATVDPAHARVMVQSMYKGDLSYIVPKEMIQNSVDAVKGRPDKGKAGKVSVNINTADRTIRVQDNGIGMLRDVVEHQFTDLGATLKQALTEQGEASESSDASGGFGVAKAAILGNAKKFTLTTHAWDPKRGRMMETQAVGDAESWLDPSRGFDVQTRALPEGTPRTETGTIIDIALVDSPRIKLEDYAARTVLRNFKNHERLPFPVELSVNDKPVTRKQSWESTEPAPAPEIKKITVTGADIHFFAEDATDPTYWVNLYMLNNGLPQLVKQISLGSKAVVVPDSITVDIRSHGTPKDVDYPWLPNRQDVHQPVEQAIEQFVKHDLAAEAIKRENQLYVDTLQKAPTSTGSRLKVVDTSGKLPPEMVDKIANNPKVTKLSEQIGRLIQRVTKVVTAENESGTYGNDLYNRGEYHGIGLGRDYYGINIEGTHVFGEGSNDIILVNPVNIIQAAERLPAQEVSEKFSARRGGLKAVDLDQVEYTPSGEQRLASMADRVDFAARRFYATSTHEVTHQVERNHSPDFSGELTVNLARTSGKIENEIDSIKRILSEDNYAVYNYLRDLHSELESAFSGPESIFSKIGLTHGAEGNEPLDAEGRRVRRGEGEDRERGGTVSPRGNRPPGSLAPGPPTGESAEHAGPPTKARRLPETRIATGREPGTDLTYEVRRQAPIVAAMRERLRTEGPEALEAWWRDAPMTDERNAAGILLSDHYQVASVEAKDPATAEALRLKGNEISNLDNQRSTIGGQSSAMWNQMHKFSPAGVAYEIVKAQERGVTVSAAEQDAATRAAVEHGKADQAVTHARTALMELEEGEGVTTTTGPGGAGAGKGAGKGPGRGRGKGGYESVVQATTRLTTPRKPRPVGKSLAQSLKDLAPTEQLREAASRMIGDTDLSKWMKETRTKYGMDADAAARLGAQAQTLLRKARKAATESNRIAALRRKFPEASTDEIAVKMDELQQAIARRRAAKLEMAQFFDRLNRKQQGYYRRSMNITRAMMVSQFATAMRNLQTQAVRFGLERATDILEHGERKALKYSMDALNSAVGRVLYDTVGLESDFTMRSISRNTLRSIGLSEKQFRAPERFAREIASEHPAQLARLFNSYAGGVDVPQLESGPIAGKVRPVVERMFKKMERASTLVNYANTLQEFHLRAAEFLSELDLHLRKDHNMSLEKFVGRFGADSIPKEIVGKAVDKALEVTFAANPGQEGLGGRALSSLIEVGNYIPPTISPIAFPKFMFNSLKFLYQYNPIGAFDLMRKGQNKPRVAARALLGSAMLLTAYGFRNSEHAGEKWYELKFGKYTLDARPFGPFSIYLFLAEVAKRARHHEKLFTPTEIMEALGSTTAVGGTVESVAGTIYNTVGNIISDRDSESNWRKLQRFLKTEAGDFGRALLTPVRQIKDLVAAFDPEEGYTRDISDQPFAGALRESLPFASRGLPVATRPTSTTPIHQEHPAIKALTGWRVETPKTFLESQLDQLHFDSSEIRPSTGLPKIDAFEKHAMGPLMDQLSKELEADPEFKTLTPARRADVIKDAILDIRNEVRDMGRAEMPEEYEQLKEERKPQRQRDLERELREEDNSSGLSSAKRLGVPMGIPPMRAGEDDLAYRARLLQVGRARRANLDNVARAGDFGVLSQTEQRNRLHRALAS